MPTLPEMGLVTPTLNGDSGTWDDKINAAFVLVDAHDHSPGKGPRVRVVGLSIDDDLPMGGYAISNTGQVAFAAVPTLVAGGTTLFVDDGDSELYWRTGGGTNVKLTNGNSINTTLVGGIVGDYTSVGAELAYDDSTDSYTFKQQGAPKTWARLRSGEVRVYETGTSESVYVGQKAPAALAASYSVTWPTALPAGTQIVTIAADGTMAFDGVLGANQDITLSGTGEYNHGDRVVSCSGMSTACTSGTYSAGASSDKVTWTLSAAGVVYVPLLGLRQGCRLKKVALFATAASEPTLAIIQQIQNAAATLTYTSSGTIVANSKKTMTLDTPQTLPNSGDEIYWLKITANAGSTTVVYELTITYDVP